MRNAIGTAGVRAGRGFTLIELLITVGVIALLIGITLVVGQAVINGGKANSTRDTLRLLDAAVDAFIQDVGKSPPGVARLPKSTGVGTDDVLPVWDGVVGAPAMDNPPQIEAATLNSGGLMLLALRSSGAAEGMLARLNTVDQRLAGGGIATTSSYGPFLTPLDGFGRPIRAVHPAFDGVLVEGDPALPLADVQLRLPTRHSFNDGITGATGVAKTDRERLVSDVQSQGLRRNGITDSDGGAAPSDRPYFYSVGEDGVAGQDENGDGQVDVDADGRPTEDGRSDNVYSVEPRFQEPILRQN